MVLNRVASFTHKNKFKKPLDFKKRRGCSGTTGCGRKSKDQHGLFDASQQYC